ncbi:MAG: hypothetical protein HRT52_00760 [Colwellia sp.]|nr:hypothetical protein [Colwellia sp.]
MNKYILILLLLLPLPGIAESETTVGLERDHPKANMKYLYGSVIRTFANISDNALIMNMMANVQLIVYGKVTLASVELAKSQFKQVIPSLLNEEYYEVIRLGEINQLLNLSELFDEFGLYALKAGDHISAIFIFRRQAQNLEFLDISGVLERTKISTSDISSLYQLLDTLNNSDLLNFTEVEDDT